MKKNVKVRTDPRETYGPPKGYVGWEARVSYFDRLGRVITDRVIVTSEGAVDERGIVLYEVERMLEGVIALRDKEET